MYKHEMYGMYRPVLTPNQAAMLTLVAHGCTNKGLTVRMGKPMKTVTNTLTRIYGKLGAVDRANAVALAMRDGLIKMEGTCERY
jgi:DNA-binding NarL/FixJ family response regulator